MISNTKDFLPFKAVFFIPKGEEEDPEDVVLQGPRFG